MSDVSEYCRQLETYLCQKNGGHLIRIVGPAFEQVRSWADQGIPLAIAYRGIDRYCERQHGMAKPRRRPVRIEFCESDILALFGEWRRAVGVAQTTGDDSAPARKPALTAHFERIVSRLVAARASRSPAFERQIERLLVELDELSAASRSARGAARERILERLTALDRELLDAAAAEIDHDSAARLRQEAEATLAPFVSRMTADVRAQALDRAYDRALRETLALPTIRYG